MSLKSIGTIEIPNAAGSSFDHGAFDAKTGRIFVAHTARNCVEVIDHDNREHVRTLPGFPGAAGVVADNGQVLVTNRGSATLAWVDAQTFATRGIFQTAPKPNGVAIAPRRGLAIAACIGDDGRGAKLHVFGLGTSQSYAIDLPGRPRWCVTDLVGQRVFLAIQNPSMVFVARLPELEETQHWRLPAQGAHGLDIDHIDSRLYVACDDGTLVELDASSGQVTSRWALAGAPDVTFFNPATDLVHVAIGDPGLIQSIDPGTRTSEQIKTAAGAHTTALAPPDRLYVFSPAHGGMLTFVDG
jgi:DNA-binding beta-propeller fold protein YncE